MQAAEHRETCRRRDEDNAEALDTEIEELLHWFDQPAPVLPSPPEETAADRVLRRMERLRAAGLEYDPEDWR